MDQSMEKVKQVFNINTFAIIRVCRAVLPVMAKHKKGLFVNIGSVVGDTCVDVFRTIRLDVLLLTDLSRGMGYTLQQRLRHISSARCLAWNVGLSIFRS